MGDWLQRLHTLIGEPNPCDNSDEMRRNSVSSHNVTNVTGISGPFPLRSMRRGCPAGGTPAATRASSGAGRSSIKTTTPPGGFAGSAPLRSRVVAPATFAGCLRTTNDDKRTSNGEAPSQVGRGA